MRKSTLILLSIDLISEYSSNPFIPGILTSITARSYYAALKVPNATLAFVKISTENSDVSNIRANVCAVSSSNQADINNFKVNYVYYL